MFVSVSVCSNRLLLFYMTTGCWHFLSSRLSYLRSRNTPPPPRGGKWQTTDRQIKGRPCIQPTEINVQPYHKLLHWRQGQSVLPKLRYPANDFFHCVLLHWSTSCVTVVTKYSCYTHCVGSTVLYYSNAVFITVCETTVHTPLNNINTPNFAVF